MRTGLKCGCQDAKSGPRETQIRCNVALDAQTPQLQSQGGEIVGYV